MGSYTNDYISELKEIVRGRLVDYLRMHGRKVNNNGSFQCLWPERHEHGDTVPSATISKSSGGTPLWYCHVCKQGGDIFNAAVALGNKDISGPGFINTVVELCSELGVPVDNEKISIAHSEYTKSLNMENLCASIAEYLSTHGNGVEHLMSGRFGRTYTREQAEAIIRIVPIGCIDSEPLTQAMRDMGYDLDQYVPMYDLESKLLDRRVFTVDRLVMAWNNPSGKPVAFVGRITNEALEQAKATGIRLPKYRFTVMSHLQKSKIPFLLNLTGPDISKCRKVFVVEGHLDTLAMYIGGIRNVIGIAGGAFSTETVALLERYNVSEIIFAFDMDKSGLNAIEHALQSIRTYGSSISTRAVEFPEGMDPDDIIRSGNMEVFEHLKDPIELYLRKHVKFNDQSIAARTRYLDALSFIVSVTELRIDYRNYAAVIADMFGYAVPDIVEDLNSSLNGKHTKQDEYKKAWKELLNCKGQGIDEEINALDITKKRLGSLVSKSATNLSERTWNRARKLFENEVELPVVLQTGLPLLDSRLSITCSALHIVGGRPSNGKTTMLQYLIYVLLCKNPGLYVYYATTDDSFEDTMVSMSAIIMGIRKDTVETYIRRGEFKHPFIDQSKLNVLEDFMRNRLCIVDLSDCTSFDAIRTEVIKTQESCRAKFPWYRHMLVVVDAMNNLEEYLEDDQRVGLERMVQNAKELSVTERVATIMVSHLIKPDKFGRTGKPPRPTTGDLKGSSYLEFEAKAIALCHMDAHYGEPFVTWRDAQGNIQPVIEVISSKDKKKKANQTTFLKLAPESGVLIEASLAEETEFKRNIAESMSSGRGRDDE